jgi:geranylgeranylglycerol-phosphate geranylgeranyltransferase
MSKVGALIRLIRPINCVMMGFAVIVGAALAGTEQLLQQLPLSLGFATGFFLTGATMAINDYYDREIDAINEPKRPIPSGAVSPKMALTLASVLTFSGFLAALFTNWQSLAIALATWVVFVLYTTKGKRTGFLGNLLVSVCIAVPFVYGGYVVEKGFMPATGIFVAIVFLANTGREVTKGIVDVEGDRRNGVQTVAVVCGNEKAAVAASVLYLAAVALTPLPWLLGIVSSWYLPFVFFADMGFILSSILLVLNPSRDNARRIKNRVLFWFLSGLLAFVAGTLAVNI